DQGEPGAGPPGLRLPVERGRLTPALVDEPYQRLPGGSPFDLHSGNAQIGDLQKFLGPEPEALVLQQPQGGVVLALSPLGLGRDIPEVVLEPVEDRGQLLMPVVRGACQEQGVPTCRAGQSGAVAKPVAGEVEVLLTVGVP